MIPLRLVVDTNILVSAALKRQGLQRTVLFLAISRPVTLYVTEAVLEEYQEVLARAELKIRSGSNFINSSKTVRGWSALCALSRSRGPSKTTSFWSAPMPLAPTTS